MSSSVDKVNRTSVHIRLIVITPALIIQNLPSTKTMTHSQEHSGLAIRLLQEKFVTRKKRCIVYWQQAGNHISS